MSEKKSNTLPIVMMYVLFFLTGFVTYLGGAMVPTLKMQFNLSDSFASLGNTAIFVVYIIMGIPAGMMLQKIGYKKTALGGLIVGFIGFIILYLSGLMENLFVYLLGALVAGMAICVFNTVVNPMLNTLGGGGNKGNQLIQGAGAAYSLASILVPVLVFNLGSSVSRVIADINPVFLGMIGIFIVVFIVLSIVEIPEPGMEKGQKVKLEHSPFAFRHYLLGTICIFIYVGAEVGIPSVLTLFLTSTADKGGFYVSPGVVGSVAGIYGFLMLVGRLLGAGFASKFSTKAMVGVMALMGLIFTIGGICTLNPDAIQVSIPTISEKLPLGVLLLVCCGLFNSVMFGGIFNLSVEGLGKYTKIASGFYMVMICGGGVLPLLQTWVAEHSSYAISYCVIACAFVYMLFYALIGCKNVNKDIEV